MKRTPLLPSLILALSICPGASSAQAQVQTQPGPPPRGQGQDLGRLPWNRDLWIAPVKSLEPLEISEPKIFLEHAGVPCVVRDAQKKGRLVAVFQWFPMGETQHDSFDQVALRLSNDDGKTWESPQTVRVSGLDLQRFQRPMDPAILQLSDGRFRLYFTSSERVASRGMDEQRPNPMGGAPQGFPQQPGTASRPNPAMVPGRPAIYSAISSDLKTFTLEEGVRSDREFRGVVDATVVTHAGITYLIGHPEGREHSPYDVRQGYFATSKDGATFERQMNLSVSIPGDFIGNLLSQPPRLHYFGGGPQGLWSMSSRDGTEWSRPTISKIKGGDPSVFVDHAGKAWLVYVGNVRSDAVGTPDWLPRPH